MTDKYPRPYIDRMRKFLLILLVAAPLSGQETIGGFDPETIYHTRSFYNFNDAINFMISLPYEKRDTARFFQLQAPGGWFHVVCRGCNPDWGKRPETTTANTWWSPDSHAGAEFRKECAKEWANNRPCWYAEFKNETILVFFNEFNAPTRAKHY